MSKKNADREKDEEKDLDEEEDEVEDEEEEEEEEERSASSRRARPRARRPEAHEAHDAHDDHGHGHGHDDEEEDEEDLDDPTWWTPHAVMSVLILLGVLGFFGAFNRFVPKGAFTAAAEKAGVTTGTEAAHGSQGSSQGAHPTPAQTAQAAQGETYGAKHLLVQYKGSMRAGPQITRTEDEAKARATEAMKKARGGTKFEDVVKEYSDEPGAAQRGGDLGKFRKGQMVPEFQAAVEKMKVGEVSDLVKTPFGYHVILRTQ
jgi:parvulin-like peptidyl-prolyl isomerase